MPILDRLDQTTDTGLWRQLNHEFHFGAYAAANSPRLLATLETLWITVEPYIHLNSQDRSNLVIAQREHREIFEALRAGDKRRAARAVEAHIRRSERARRLDRVDGGEELERPVAAVALADHPALARSRGGEERGGPALRRPPLGP